MSRYDREQVKNLIIGVTGVLLVYWLSGLLHQGLIKETFLNRKTGKQEKFEYMIPLVFFPAFFTWLLGLVYNIRLPHRVQIPAKNSFSCGFIVFVSGFCLNEAIQKTSYPIVMAGKASNILAVLLVAILCTRVRDKSLNLPAKKIILGIIITIGVFIFTFFDPQSSKRQIKTEALGIFMIIASLIADGFLPDFQAEIKSEFKPEPSQMMVEINKSVAIICFFFTVVSFEIWDVIIFIIYHPSFVVVLIAFSLTGFFGQIFIYRLIKQFKQHIVPFVVTIRKIFTVIINILYYGHSTSLLQLMGMVIVSTAILSEFLVELKGKQQKQQKFQKVTSEAEEMETQRATLESEQN